MAVHKISGYIFVSLRPVPAHDLNISFDLAKDRNLIIAAVMFVSGLGFSSVGGITFTVGGAAVTLSGLAIAALCGVILNAILPGNDYVFGASVQGDKSADLGSY